MGTWSTAVIGERVRERREALGLSQAELARQLGIAPPNMSAIEAGRVGVSLERLLQLAEVLRCGPNDLTKAAR